MAYTDVRISSEVSRLAKSLGGAPQTMRANRGDPEALLPRLMPLGRRSGITRVGDLTGLDFVGLPVVQAVRPAALSEVTSLGKGNSLRQAAVGALMECFERFYAESIETSRLFSASAGELGIPDGLYDGHVAKPEFGGWRQSEIMWIAGLDLAEKSVLPVPYELVHTRYTRPPPPGDGFFFRTTTGLACHTTVTAAIVHGLLECVERDAISRAFRTHGFFDRMRVDFRSLPEDVATLLERLNQIHIRVAFWRAPSPTGIHVIWCQTIECGPGEPIVAMPTEGYSAGLSLEAAVRAALFEAVSARAGAISGAREDQTRRHYRRSNDSNVVRARELVVNGAKHAQLRDIAEAEVFCPDALVGRVMTACLGPVLAIPLGSDEIYGVECVRVILAHSLPLSSTR